jgi:hypothetical protein
LPIERTGFSASAPWAFNSQLQIADWKFEIENPEQNNLAPLSVNPQRGEGLQIEDWKFQI